MWLNVGLSACLAVLTGLAAYEWQAKNIDILKGQHVIELRVRDAALSAANDAAKTQVLDAQNAARKRESVLRNERDSLGGELAGVRDASTKAADRAGTPANCPDAADTLRIVFNQCATRLVEVAGNADRHVSDLQTFIDAGR